MIPTKEFKGNACGEHAKLTVERYDTEYGITIGNSVDSSHIYLDNSTIQDLKKFLMTRRKPK